MLRASVLVVFTVLAAAPAKSNWVVPNFHDLMIKTRATHGLSNPMTTAWYFKGPRQRTEHLAEAKLNRLPFVANIMQCDLRTHILLFELTKTYHSFVIPEERERERTRLHPVPPKPPAGTDVTVTSDSVDTGERRQIGSYEAHRIKTTITIEPGKDAATKPGKVEIDGWYLDLPGLNCHEVSPREGENVPPLAEWMMLVRGAAHDHLIFKNLGTPPRGLVVEESSTQRQAGNTIVNKTELLEASDQPLDESLFEVPPDYVPREKPESHTLQKIPDSNSPQP
jgi:hypothetical protein